MTAQRIPCSHCTSEIYCEMNGCQRSVLLRANDQLFTQGQKMFDDREYWKKRAQQFEEAYLNMRDWARENGLDTTARAPMTTPDAVR